MITAKHKSKKSTHKTSSSSSLKRAEKSIRGKKEDILYPREAESADQSEGTDATFTEHNDVTPPNRKEFPSVGAAKTDFESRPHGRTTGRMIGHEPGTEGI